MTARKGQPQKPNPKPSTSTSASTANASSSTATTADQTRSSSTAGMSMGNLPLPLEELHRLLTLNTPVVPQVIPVVQISPEVPQSIPVLEVHHAPLAVPCRPFHSPVVTRLPFFSPVVTRLPFNFNFPVVSGLSPQANDTIDLCEEDGSPMPVIDLEQELEEGELDTTLPIDNPSPIPVSMSKRGRSNSKRGRGSFKSKSPRGPKSSSNDPNDLPITEIVLDSDDEDDIEVVGIVSSGESSMAGGGRARGALRVSGRVRKSFKRARVGSVPSNSNTPLGVQRGGNQVGVARTPVHLRRGGSKVVKGGRIEKKMNWKKGQTRWGTPLPITKRRKSLRLAAAVATMASNTRKPPSLKKDSPFMRRLENINPTHRGLIKQRYYPQQGTGSSNIHHASAGPSVPRNQPFIVRNPVNRNNANLFPITSQRLLPVRRAPLGNPRPIVIDGSNVAVGHGGPSKQFSCRGLEIMVRKIQLELPHKEIVVFVPRFRAKLSESKDTYILDNLEKDGVLKYTPSRDVGGKRISSYDDRFIVEYAFKTGGIIISNDNFRDLYNSEPNWRDTISSRLLQFTWVNDLLMFPDDPLGKDGPNLEEFMCFPAQATLNY